MSDLPPPIHSTQISQTTQKKGIHAGIVVLVVVASLFLVLGVLGALAGLFLPIFSQGQKSALRVKSVNNVKVLARAMIVYATDNDLNFPEKGDYKSSDELFQRVVLDGGLVPKGVFWIKSPLSPQIPIEDNSLKPGENVYLYVADQSLGSFTFSPLIADGLMEKQGVYSKDHPFSSQQKAIVGYVDGHIEIMDLQDSKVVYDDGKEVFKPLIDGGMLDVSGDSILYPAIAPINQ